MLASFHSVTNNELAKIVEEDGTIEKAKVFYPFIHVYVLLFLILCWIFYFSCWTTFY